MSKFYRYFKFDADNSTVRFKDLDLTVDNGITITSGGLTLTAGGQTITAGGQTITAGGQTITAGGQTVTAGDVKVVGGQFFAGNKIYLGGTTTAAVSLQTGTVAPAAYGAIGSLYINTVTASMYIQTATNAWSQFATPF